MSLVKSDRFNHYAGWAAYASAVCWIIGNVTVLLFYALELPQSLAGGTEPHIFGPLSDYASTLQFVFLAPLPLALWQMSSSRRASSGSFAAALGVIGSLTGAVAQGLLVAHVVEFEVNLPIILVALALIGAWMFLASQRGQSEGFFSSRLAQLGKLTGASLALLTALVFAGVMAAALNPRVVSDLGAPTGANLALIVAAVLVIPGALAYFFGVPLWLIGLGRRLLSAPVAQQQSDRQPEPLGAPR
jgi:hypothetical protein